MPNIHLTKPMQEFAASQIEAGAYADLSELVRAGLRTLMGRDRARAFLMPKAELNEFAEAAEHGDRAPFDPVAYEPDAFR